MELVHPAGKSKTGARGPGGRLREESVNEVGGEAAGCQSSLCVVGREEQCGVMMTRPAAAA